MAATPPLLQFVPLAQPEAPDTMLITLAERASAQPQPPGTGRYDYIHTRTWTLATEADTTGKAFDARIAESDRELWVSDDGDGWYEETRDGVRTRTSGWQTYVEGRPPTVSGTDAEAIENGLSRRHPDWRGAEWITFISQRWAGQTVTPAVQAALLRALARTTDLTVEGGVTDRAGRRGVAVSAVTSHGGLALDRHILVLDETTGGVLGTEKGRPGKARPTRHDARHGQVQPVARLRLRQRATRTTRRVATLGFLAASGRAVAGTVPRGAGPGLVRREIRRSVGSGALGEPVEAVSA